MKEFRFELRNDATRSSLMPSTTHIAVLFGGGTDFINNRGHVGRPGQGGQSHLGE